MKKLLLLPIFFLIFDNLTAQTVAKKWLGITKYELIQKKGYYYEVKYVDGLKTLTYENEDGVVIGYIFTEDNRVLAVVIAHGPISLEGFHDLKEKFNREHVKVKGKGNEYIIDNETIMALMYDPENKTALLVFSSR